MAGFTEAPQVLLGTEEKLDDLSTWSMDAIREVATDIYAFCDPTSLYNGDIGNDESSKKDFLDTHEGPDLGHVSLSSLSSGKNTLFRPSSTVRSRLPRVKMYELPFQSDSKLEERRKRARCQWEQRQRKKQETEQMKNELEVVNRQVAQLTQEADRHRKRVQKLEQYVFSSSGRFC